MNCRARHKEELRGTGPLKLGFETVDNEGENPGQMEDKPVNA